MLNRFLSKSFTLKRYGKKRNLKANEPDWGSILNNKTQDPNSWPSALTSEKTHRVLIATSVGAYLPGILIESLLAAALTLRHAEVHLLLCDSALDACFYCSADATLSANELAQGKIRTKLCRHCVEYGTRVFGPMGLTLHRYSDYLSKTIECDMPPDVEALIDEMDANALKQVSIDGVSIGEHALAGALRFFARGTLEGEPHGKAVLRRYLNAALTTATAMETLLTRHAFDCVVFHHGIYIPMGIIGEVCRKHGVRVVNWNPAYRRQCFIFSHHHSYHHTLLDEPVDTWQHMPWNSEREREIMDYLQSRWQGTRDWIWFHENPEEDLERIARETGVDFSKPVIGLLTNVVWDAQLHFKTNVFPDMLTWVIRTIDYFAKRPDVQLLIRIHPAEIRGTLKSRQPLLTEIQTVFPDIPSNVHIIPPESPISTYAAMMACDSVIIYGTKTGVELTSMGIPVIVGGEAWIRNKGLTIDAASPEDYLRQLDRLPLGKRMDPETVQSARKYAYHFFFRRMIPLTGIQATDGWPPYRLGISSLDQLRPGVDPGLDLICRGILENEPFVFDHS
ncbi:MAG: capsule biosynthesis protein [Candidatus Omnitrophota bacterium]